MIIVKCSHCESKNVVESTDIYSRKPVIKGLKIIKCLSCGYSGYTQGETKKPPRMKKLSKFVGMSIKEALSSGISVGAVVTVYGIRGYGLVMEASKESPDCAHVNGKAVYFQSVGQYAMGWLSNKIESVQIPAKQKKTKSK